MGKRLYRSRKESILGGVAGGLADYFGVDVTVVRLVIVLMAFLLSVGAVAVAYIVAWLIIPLEPAGTGSAEAKPRSGEGGENAARPAAGETEPEGPVAPATAGSEKATGETGTGGQPSPRIVTGDPTKVRNRETATKQFVGWAMVLVGALLLARRIIPQFWWQMPWRLVTHWWPLGLVGLGVLIVISALRR